MTSKEKDATSKLKKEIPMSGDEIVISGISGLFPKSNNVAEFMENLYNKVDMISNVDMNLDHPEAPKHLGQITGIRKFDAQFFKVTHNQASSLEPTSRKLMEHAYMAMYDSGINPLAYKNTKIGVYIGSSYMDSSNMSLYTALKQNGFIISGGSRCMLSNRISYFLDGKAPSISLDCACSSTMVCLEKAYNDMKSGICETALVGGCQICLHPTLTLNIKRTGVLCLDGKTKCFDKHGDGYVRSEAINVFFLQKAKDAKRIYAEVYHAKTKYGLKPDAAFLPFRTAEDINNFLSEFYSEAGVSANEVEYIEAHGTAIAEADANELAAIGDVFAKDKPILVGCVKSNMGNSEPASGACAVTKLCLAYNKGTLAANIHYDEPLDIPAVKDGKVEVIKENKSFKRGFTAINSFSYTGINCHALLKGHFKAKDRSRYLCNIPRLILVSGRYEKGIEKIFNILKEQPIDPELIGMLHNIYQVETPGHTCRGYTIIDSNDRNETVSLSQSTILNQGSRRPLWFVFSGMGSQWAGMGAELMHIPIFAAAIEKCSKILEPKGVDLMRILTEPDNSIFDYILNCFVGIAAVQIGLVDILKAIDIVPDNIIGHSVGEMGCAYYDGCFTAEEMILAAYARGLVSVETKFIEGSMAAVGLGYNEIHGLVPPEIDIACHNSSESTTLSGPANEMKRFVAELVAKGIFAKEVPCGNIAYHSRYISKAGPDFLKKLRKVTEKSVPRSKKWICTSFPPEKWENPVAKFSSPEYHANNLLSPVYFEDAAKKIPRDAVIVEIAPHGLLQAILKRSHKECTHIPLTRRGHSQPLIFFFEALGKLYQEGYTPKINVLYPQIEYPVSTETSLISHYMALYHEEDWPIAIHDARLNVVTPTRKLAMSLLDDDYKLLSGCVIEDNIVLPESAILVFLWETLAMYKGQSNKKMSVAFRDVHFHGDVIIDPDETLRLELSISKGTDYFEVTRESILVASGYIYEVPKSTLTHIVEESNEDVMMSSEDIYQIFHLKGYYFKDEFQSVVSSSMNWNYAKVKWNNQWITFLDSLIQLNILAKDHDGISTPKIIKKLVINIFDHINAIKALKDPILKVQLQKHNGITRCGGIEIRDIIFRNKPFPRTKLDMLYTLQYVPHVINNHIKLEEALQVNLQILLDNITQDIITVAVNLNTVSSEIVGMITNTLENIPNVDFKICYEENVNTKSILNSNLLIDYNFLKNPKYEDFYSNKENNTFVLTIEDSKPNLNRTDFNIISSMQTERNILVLLHKASIQDKNIMLLPVTNEVSFSWVPQVKTELKKSRKVILLSENQSQSGLFGLVKKLMKEYPNKIGLFSIDDPHSPSFDTENNIFIDQLKKNLVFNILKKGQWGSYYYLPCRKSGSFQINYNLTCTMPGDMNSLEWAETYSKIRLNNLVQVCFAGPSLRDAQKAVGIIEEETEVFGMDFSGIDKNGSKVMGLVASGAISSTVEPDQDLLWPVPDHWTLEEAATVPLPFVHAYYCLILRCQLHPQHTVFVTGGAGALGQAVISICLSLGCTVYTCVGDIYKKRLLMKLFPKLNDKNIGFSYDTGFYHMVAHHSKNKRCDVVINCISGPMREFAMRCVGFWGLFLDVNRHDMRQDKSMGMSYLNEDRAYKSVDLSNVFKLKTYDEKKLLQKVVSEGIANGVVKPITYVTYSTGDVQKAFRLLSLNRHRGRVLIKFQDPGAPTKTMSVLPRMTYSSKGTFVVICDKSNIGIELAHHLVNRGVRKLNIHLKSEKISGYLQDKLKMWQHSGVTVKLSTDSLQSKINCRKLLSDENKLELIYGIFTIQACSGDDSYEQEDFVNKRNEITSVVDNLDLISRNNCPELRIFAVISRASQNVVDEYITSVLDQICQSRVENGLPALLFRTEILNKNSPKSLILKTQSQTIKAAIAALENSLKQKFTNVLNCHVKKTKSAELIKKIGSVLGVEDLREFNDNYTLKDILANDISMEELKLVIKDNNKLEFTSDDIKEMSVARIKSLCNSIKKQNTKFDSGFGAFCNFVDKDENLATEAIVSMTSILSSPTETEKEINANGTFLMLIPGFEGHHHIFGPICERLKIKAVTFQLRPESSTKSIQKMAQDVKTFMIRRFAMKSKFYLLGYSFGINVALEVAALLETDGLIGIVYCLDSSPDALRVQLDAYLGKLSEEKLQNLIIEHLFYVMSGQRNGNLNKEIEAKQTWSEKVDLCIQKLKTVVTLTSQYERAIIESVYRRVMLARNYEPNFKLKSELVLLKGIPHPKAKPLSFDYNLSKYTTTSVKVFDIPSDVASAPEDCRVSNIVNQLLDPVLLEDFKMKNLCQTYLTSPIRIE